MMMMNSKKPNSILKNLFFLVHRQALINSKLNHLLQRTTTTTTQSIITPTTSSSSTLPFPCLGTLDQDPEERSRGWALNLWPVKHLLPRRSTPTSLLTNDDDHDDVPPSEPTPTELTTTCPCGRRMTLQLPPYQIQSTSNHVSDHPSHPAFNWPDAIMSLVIWMAVMLKHSPIPYWFRLLMGSCLTMMWEVEASLQIRNRIMKLIWHSLQRLAELDAELGLHRALGDILAWMVELILKASLAFARAEAYEVKPSEPQMIASQAVSNADSRMSASSMSSSDPSTPSSPTPSPRRTQSPGPNPHPSTHASHLQPSLTPRSRHTSFGFLSHRTSSSPSIPSSPTTTHSHHTHSNNSNNNHNHPDETLFKNSRHEPLSREETTKVKSWTGSVVGRLGYHTPSSSPPRPSFFHS